LCQEIFSGCLRPASKLEVSTFDTLVSNEVSYPEEKNGLEILDGCRFPMPYKAPIIAAVLKDMIRTT
jgi:hypothetical protein